MTTTKMNQTAKVLRLLKSRRFVLNTELNRLCFRYGARIHELRKEGWNIQQECIKPGLYRYWIVHEREHGDS